MAKEFTYFAGTLPMLFFGEKPAMSLEAFDEDALRLTDASTAELLRKVALYTENTADFPEAVKKFYDFENSFVIPSLICGKRYVPMPGITNATIRIFIRRSPPPRHRRSTTPICWKRKKLSTVCVGMRWRISVPVITLILLRWRFTA